MDLTLNESQVKALKGILETYKDLQNEIYNYPEPSTLFTSTQQEVFEMFDLDDYRPINTAPKDGSLIFAKNEQGEIAAVQWFGCGPGAEEGYWETKVSFDPISWKPIK
jgi:hypothetical protein